MQAIEQKKHQTMLQVICKFDDLSAIYGHIISEGQEEIIKGNIAEFKCSYDSYNLLLKELEDCIGNYRELHDKLQRIMFPYVRKMNTKARNKKH